MQINEQEYIEKFLWIVSKDTKEIPFKYNSVQQHIERSLTIGKSKGYRRFLILKARKQGASSLVLAKFLIRCLTLENRRAVVISHESGATQRLLGRVYSYIKSLFAPPPIDKESTKEISFTETKSSFYIGTAGSKAFGRGDDITDLHVSELDWWEHTDSLTGLLEACIPDAEVIVETTGNGFGSKFHGLWTKAKTGENEYYPIFVPWFLSDEYDRPDLVTAEFKLDDDEITLKQRYGLRDSQIAWRRWKLRTMDRPELFPQEYPANDMEAFLTSGNAVFDSSTLTDWYNKPHAYEDGILEDVEGVVKFTKEDRGWCRVFVHPIETVSYRIGADVSEGIENEAKDRDYSTASVKNGTTWEQVACMRYRVDPDIHAERLALLGRYYNTAVLGVERNAVGIATLSFLQTVYKYPKLYYQKILDERTRRETKKFGWNEDEKSRGMLIALQKKAIREGSTKINDPQTILEHMSFITNGHGRAEAAGGAHDDTVFADMICTMMCDVNPTYDPTERWEMKQFGGASAINTKMDEYMRKKGRRW